MLLLRPVEVAALTRIVQLHHLAFITEVCGAEAAGLSPDQVQELVALGVLDAGGVTELLQDPIGDSWVTGLVLARLRDLGDPDLQGEDLSYDQVEAELRRDPVPLGPLERRAIQAARNSAGQYCRGLGNTVDNQLRTVAIEADDQQAAWFREHIREATAETVARRETISHLRGELGRRTGDWARDLERIAETELQNVQSEAVLTQAEADDGGEARLAKIPEPGACPSCIAAYTTDGVTPRVFTAAELRANGSNVGRKEADRLPVAESHHPRCRCPLVAVPAGYAFEGRELKRIEELRKGLDFEELEKAHPGLSLLPSKVDPRVKRWQRMTTVNAADTPGDAPERVAPEQDWADRHRAALVSLQRLLDKHLQRNCGQKARGRHRRGVGVYQGSTEATSLSEFSDRSIRVFDRGLGAAAAVGLAHRQKEVFLSRVFPEEEEQAAIELAQELGWFDPLPVLAVRAKGKAEVILQAIGNHGEQNPLPGLTIVKAGGGQIEIRFLLFDDAQASIRSLLNAIHQVAPIRDVSCGWIVSKISGSPDGLQEAMENHRDNLRRHGYTKQEIQDLKRGG